MSAASIKRPIDRQRESAGMIEVGTPDDQSAVKATFAINGTLHAIKEKGIYEIKLADNIDPDRLNLAVPNTQQRVLEIGSDSELVGRSLLTDKVYSTKAISQTLSILTNALAKHLQF